MSFYESLRIHRHIIQISCVVKGLNGLHLSGDTLRLGTRLLAQLICNQVFLYRCVISNGLVFPIMLSCLRWNIETHQSHTFNAMGLPVDSSLAFFYCLLFIPFSVCRQNWKDFSLCQRIRMVLSQKETLWGGLIRKEYVLNFDGRDFFFCQLKRKHWSWTGKVILHNNTSVNLDV